MSGAATGLTGPEARSITRAFADLHTHSRASFDSLASPGSLVRTAARHGLTHLAITDHDRIDGALEAREQAGAIAPGLTVIVGEEVRTADGDLICLFLDEAIPPGLPAEEAIARARAQGGLVGVPHPFDRFRGSLLRDARMERLAGQVDWIETHNARIALGNGNQLAADFAHDHGQPGRPVRGSIAGLERPVDPIVVGDREMGQAARACGSDERCRRRERVERRAGVHVQVREEPRGSPELGHPPRPARPGTS